MYGVKQLTSKASVGTMVGGMAAGALAMFAEPFLLGPLQSLPLIGQFISANIWRAILVGNGAAIGNAVASNISISSFRDIWAILSEAVILMLTAQISFWVLATSDTPPSLLYVLPLAVGEMTRLLVHAAVASTIGRMVDTTVM